MSAIYFCLIRFKASVCDFIWYYYKILCVLRSRGFATGSLLSVRKDCFTAEGKMFHMASNQAGAGPCV